MQEAEPDVVAEVSALLANPPPWLDIDTPHDLAPTKMMVAAQRGRNRAQKLSFLSIISHLEVEMRDPYEGQMDDSFYERLAELRSGQQQASTRPTLRFAIGQRVLCFTGSWAGGRIVDLWYRERSWAPGQVVPYQIELDDGRRVYAPRDSDRLVRLAKDAHEPDGDEGRGASPGEPDMADAPGGSDSGSNGAAQEAPPAGKRRAIDGPAAPAGKRLKSEDGGAAAGASAPSAATLSLAGESEAQDCTEATDGGDDAGALCGSSAGAAAAQYTIASTLALLVEALRGPLPLRHTASDEHSDAVERYAEAWRETAEGHAHELQTMKEYRSMCLHADLFAGGPQPGWFAPSFAAAFADGVPSAASIRDLVQEISPGIYAFDFLSAELCERLLAELEHYEGSGLPVSRPNSMNRYGVVLNLIGMERTMDALQRAYVRPIAAALFPVEGEHVDHHHTFMVQYKQGEDLGLDMHTDACDVTLNVCLGKEFTGAGLTFCGLRGDAGRHERRFSYRYTHVKGRAIMHLGRHRHGADDIETGERFNLIMWNKSSSFRVSRDFMGKHARPPSTEEAPDLVCLSYTHDDDYEQFKPYPPGRKKPERGG